MAKFSVQPEKTRATGSREMASFSQAPKAMGLITDPPRALPRQPVYVVDDDSTFEPISAALPSSAAPPPASRAPESFLYRLLAKPRWKPWPLRKTALTAVAFGGCLSLLILLSPKLISETRALLLATIRATKPTAALAATEVSLPEAPPPVEDRADAALSRQGRSPVAGGLLTLPPTFASADGAFDLVIHFHGNTDLVEESFHRSGINAAVVIMNLGIGSGPYEDRYANPWTLPDVLDRTRNALEKRGLRDAKLRRLGLTAWSAGYGSVARILDQPALAEKVDAVALLDGIHCGYHTGTHHLLLERIAPFERFARLATENKKLFLITHSNIIPMGNYAGTRETTDALLMGVGVPRSPGGTVPKMPALASMEGVLPKKLLRAMEPVSETVRGGLTVRGYAGDQPENHVMHLVQMSETALPDLIAHWSEPKAR